MADPFFKAAGGKRLLLHELLPHVPKTFGRYYEPFVGGGALFFHLQSLGWPLAARVPQPQTWAVLNDLNPYMMAAYHAARNAPQKLIIELSVMAAAWARADARGEGAEHYYAVRAAVPVHSGAWFLLMNRLCFNGLWRVNKAGKYNVPYGKWKTPPTICDEAKLEAASAALRGAMLLCGDFDEFERDHQRPHAPVRGDFMYFDPPYWPASATSDFTAYTKEPFGPAEQERLRDYALALKNRGVRVLLSNADVEPVRKLYAKGFEMRRIEARRSVNSVGSKRGKVGELLIW